MTDDDSELWLLPEVVRQRVGAWLASRAIHEVSVEQIAYEVFNLSYPSRGTRTQIGSALAFLGWRRVERRRELPRYRYVRP